jgi:hypothetical protein
MVCPKPHDFTPGTNTTVRESTDNIPIGTHRVRVQTVNANGSAKKCGIKLYGHDLYENESAILREI